MALELPSARGAPENPGHPSMLRELREPQCRSPKLRGTLAALILALGLVAIPLAAGAQQTGTVYCIGILTPAGRPIASSPGGATVIVPKALGELGYVEGRNLVVERRFAEGKIERLPALARELAGLRVDVIVAVSAGAVQAAMEATKTIPIVMIASDPVGHGLVANLARPGGNVTGVATVPEADLVSKRLSLIKEAVPRVPRIAVLTTGEPSARTQVEKARQTARSLGVNLVVVEVQDTVHDRAFATMMTAGAGALFVVASPVLNRDRKRIHELAAKHRIPAIYDWPDNADEGGLMAYGSRGPTERIANYVVKILEGAKPADLPVEQPTKLELVVNLRTAKALGLTIPSSLLLQADQLIE